MPKTKIMNMYYIGFNGKHSSFRPVAAGTLHEARRKFAEFHKVKMSEDIVASRHYKEMTERYDKLIK